jgi:hypothetical protein
MARSSSTVMETQENLWLVQVRSNDPKLLAVPTNAGVDYYK